MSTTIHSKTFSQVFDTGATPAGGIRKVTTDPNPDWSIKEYAVAYARLVNRCRELNEELVRTRAALVEAERAAIEARNDRRGRFRKPKK